MTSKKSSKKRSSRVSQLMAAAREVAEESARRLRAEEATERARLRRTPEAQAARQLAAFWTARAEQLEAPGEHPDLRALYAEQALRALAAPFLEPTKERKRELLFHALRWEAVDVRILGREPHEAARAVVMEVQKCLPEDATKIDVTTLAEALDEWENEAAGRKAKGRLGKWSALSAATMKTSFAQDAEGWNRSHKAFLRKRKRR